MTSQARSRKNAASKPNKEHWDRTLTIRKRQVNVYLPDLETKERWKDFAMKKRGRAKPRRREDGTLSTPHGLLSSLIVEIVNKAIAEDKNPDHVPNGTLLKEIDELKKENVDLSKKLRRAEELADRLDEELMGYRGKDFTTADFEGVRYYDKKKLIRILKENNPIGDDAIFRKMGIDPSDLTDPKKVELVKGVKAQLDFLHEELGLVNPTPKGWSWRGAIA